MKSRSCAKNAIDGKIVGRIFQRFFFRKTQKSYPAIWLKIQEIDNLFQIVEIIDFSRNRPKIQIKFSKLLSLVAIRNIRHEYR